MHSGFKGTRIGLSSLSMADNRIDFEIMFIDSEGVVHGRMRHTRMLGSESDINTKADALITALLNEVAAMHYTSPASNIAASDLASGGGGAVGLAEALGAAPSAPDEPEGTPG
jgi:hypothetical protein